ncbi:L,D-transpeptidase family protein [Clostridium rectalis]|uniref:L,D-transpeptidase family protein n=1 Tax=Clostridium rectalis TaxID=2040295 RepID=UPI000F63D103|nr:L,D-transpeptidase [Clostridium rectalis]
MYRKGLKFLLVFLTLTLLALTIKFIPKITSLSLHNFNLDTSKSTSKENNNKIFFTQPSAAPSSTLLKVYKRNRTMELYGDNKLIGRFKISSGRSPKGTKRIEGDCKTPEGKYYICSKTQNTKYTLFMGISYPNINDAYNGLNNKIIDKKTYDTIKKSNSNRTLPPWNTPLGGAVGIHGGGTKYDWTYGCVAVSDSDIKTLWKYCTYKTPVEIYK